MSYFFFRILNNQLVYAKGRQTLNQHLKPDGHEIKLICRILKLNRIKKNMQTYIKLNTFVLFMVINP